MAQVIRRLPCFTVLLLVFAACSGANPVVPVSPLAEIPGNIDTVYESALPRLKLLISEGTEVVRIDRSDTMTLRFSIPARDDSTRLVEASLTQSGKDLVRISVRSRRFSFVMKPPRDPIDLEVENRILALLSPIESNAR